MSWNLEEAVAYYQSLGAPRDQSALIGLLREIQREHGGYIPKHLLTAAAQACGVPESLLLALVKRIPSLRLGDVHQLVLCAGPNCGKHARLAACAQALQAASGGKIDLQFGPCMRMCGKGPNIRWDGVLYHQATEELLQQLAAESK